MRFPWLAPVALLSLVACSARSISSASPPDAAVADAAVADAAPAVDRPVAAPCTAGRIESCPCADGNGTGAQTCGTDGVYGPCVCARIDAGAPAPDVAVEVDVPPVGTPDAAAQTYDYVITRLLVDEGAEPGVTTRAFFGFNLDHRFSPSRTASQAADDCSHGDYFSALDPDQNAGTCTAGAAGGGAGCQGGVDNQLPNVAQTIMQFQASLNVQSMLDDAITSGRLLILLRVSGVNGVPGPTLNDPAVSVSVFPYAWATFADCAGILTPGRSYAVDNRSLLTSGDLDSARFRYPASIVNGRLRIDASAAGDATSTFAIQPPALPLFGPGATAFPAFSFFRTQLRVGLAETASTDGNLGGFMRQGDLVDALTTVPALMQFRDAAGPLVQGFVDVATGAAPARCDAPQGGIGVGFGFHTLRATIAPAPVTGPSAGTCGSAPR
jgi:hypothetical protein